MNRQELEKAISDHLREAAWKGEWRTPDGNNVMDRVKADVPVIADFVEGLTQKLLPHHPEEWSRYEHQVGHRVDDAGITAAIELNTPGLVHPDACMDCAANPELAAKVHAAEEVAKAAIAEVAKFLPEDTDYNVVMNLTLSAVMTYQDAYLASEVLNPR